MSKSYLRRYCDLTSLIYVLKKRAITLIDPSMWDDGNDTHYLTVYKEAKNLKSVLAVCFTQRGERYHHWRVFANGPSGVCITFDRSSLLKAVRSHPRVKAKTVRYIPLKAVREADHPPVSQLPFLKRLGFEDEREFRIVYGSNGTKSTLDLPIPMSSIKKVTLGPWVHPGVFETVKDVLGSISGCEKIEMIRSTLIGNEEWKDFGDGARSLGEEV